MLTIEEHIDNLVRHIELVRGACLLLGKRLIKQGRLTLGRQVIARGFVHDASKFYGSEWKYLHAGKDIPPDKLADAIQQHQETNDHHPECWEGGIENMPELAVAEMVCDWYARAQEFGTGLREWIRTQAIGRFGIKPSMSQHGWIENFVDILLEDHFVREGDEPCEKKARTKSKESTPASRRKSA